MGARLNARIDDGLARKVAQVQRQTKKALTDIVKESLEQYCDAALARPSAMAIFRGAGLVGCSHGPSDLSSSYKAELTRPRHATF